MLYFSRVYSPQRVNAELHGVEVRLDVLHACVSAPEVFKAAPSRGFDLIVSNPPYIKTCEWQVLQPEVRTWESREALDGGEDGLDVVRMILSSSFPTDTPGVHGSLQVGVKSERELTGPIETYAGNRSEDGVQNHCSILRSRGGAIWMELDVNQPIYLQEQMQNAAGVGAWWSAPENECEPIRRCGKDGVENRSGSEWKISPVAPILQVDQGAMARIRMHQSRIVHERSYFRISRPGIKSGLLPVDKSFRCSDVGTSAGCCWQGIERNRVSQASYDRGCSHQFMHKQIVWPHGDLPVADM